MPHPLLELALHVAALGTDAEVALLQGLPAQAHALWQAAEQQAQADAQAKLESWQPPAWAAGQAPVELLQGLLPLLLQALRHGEYLVPTSPPDVAGAWAWRNRWLLDLARSWGRHRLPLHTVPQQSPAGTQAACQLKLLLHDPHACCGQVLLLRLVRVHAPGSGLAIAPLPNSAFLPLTSDFQHALHDVRGLLLHHLAAHDACQDIALGWDLQAPAQLLWALEGPSAGGALALGGLWLLRDLLAPGDLRTQLHRIQQGMLFDTHVSAAIANALGGFGTVGQLPAKAAALAAHAQARQQTITVHAAWADEQQLGSNQAQVIGHPDLPALVRHIADLRPTLTAAQDALLQALLAHDLNQMQPPALDDDLLRQVAEIDLVRSLPHYALQRWAWWARASHGALHNRYVPLRLAADGQGVDDLPYAGLQQLLHENRGRGMAALLLRGAPGAGKSTLLQHHEQHLCHRLLLQWHAGLPIEQVPFYLPLSSLQAAEHVVDAWLPRLLRGQPAEVQALLDGANRSPGSPDPVLLLDGLNELETPEGLHRNDRAVDVLQQVRRHVAPAGPLLLCARSHHVFDLQSAVRAVPVDLLPWDDDEVRHYIERRLGTPSGSDDLWQALQRAPTVLEMCRNPFNLNGQCRLWQAMPAGSAKRLAIHRNDLFRRLLWEALAREVQPAEGTRMRSDWAPDADLLAPEQRRALREPGVLLREHLPPWPAGRGQLLPALFRQGRQQWLQLGQRQPPVPARERGAVELRWNNPLDATRPPQARQSVVHWLTDDPLLGPDPTRRERWRQRVANLGLLDEFRASGDRGAADADRGERSFKWRHQSWGEWLASVDLLPESPEQMPLAEREALAAQLRRGNAFVHTTPEAELQHLQDQAIALWDASQWPAPHTHYWLRVLEPNSDELRALACPVGQVQRWLRDVYGLSEADFAVRSDVPIEAMSRWQRYLDVGAITLRDGPDGLPLCQPDLRTWGSALQVGDAISLPPGQPWYSRPDGWRQLVLDHLWGPFKDRIWQALGEPRRRLLTEQAGTLQGPPVGDLDEVLGMALLGLPDARPWLRWLLQQQLWWPLAPVLPDLRRLLEGGVTGAWASPCAELQHLRRVLLLLSLDTGASVANRVQASGMLLGLDQAADLSPDDSLQHQWLALRTQAFGDGVDLRQRLQAGLMLGSLGDSLRYERVPAAGGHGLRPRAGLWATVPAGRHGIGSDPHDAFRRGDESPVFGSLQQPAFQIARLPLTVAEWQHFIDAEGYAADAPWWQAEVVGHAGRAWLLQGRAVGRLHRPRGWGQKWLCNPLQPVVGIALFEALAYAAWAATMPTDGPAPAVPTELQWEACVQDRPLAAPFDARQQAVWPHPVPPEGPGPLDFNHSGTRWGRPSPVGVFSNSFTDGGVADAAGNVWEWCCNSASSESAMGHGCETRRSGVSANWNLANGDSVRTLRGGSYRSTASDCRPAVRLRLTPANDDNDFGVRLVRIWPPKSESPTPIPE